MTLKFPFLITAGSPTVRDALMEYADVDYKALIKIEGKPMITYVIEAIIASEAASYILIAGIPENTITIPDGFDRDRVSFKMLEGRLVDKIQAGAAEMLRISEKIDGIFPEGLQKIIITTGDIPTIMPEAITQFIQDCSESNFSDTFYHSMVPKDIMEKTFPGSGRSYMNLRDISLCGGDMEMVDAPDLVAKYDVIVRLTENRKFFLKGLFSFSPWLMFRYIFKRVKFQETSHIMTHLLTVPSRIVPTKYAELGFDVDKPHQLEMAREYLVSKLA
ncbi:MAG: hypothetical protein INQ03_22235 [Candidatus Heimdallarchaeota archaeon]|nr:hypothetical protein [Candidatus Heimdallarchaeota archaeon]